MVALQINKSDVFFDSISSISNFSVFDMVWKRYVKFALPKITKAIHILQADKPNLRLLTPEEARLQLEQIEPIVVFLLKYKNDMKAIHETDKQEFIQKSLELINEIEATAEILEDVISNSKNSLSYSPQIINVNSKQFILHHPLLCLFEKEEDYYVINNAQLDIIGTGTTQEEAEINFNEEFCYLYTKLNSLEDTQLSKRLIRIKGVINSFVKEVV